MLDKNLIKADGVVKKVFPNMQFEVELINGSTILAYLSGRMRKGPRIMIEDKVEVEISPYDLTKGRIVWLKKEN